MKNWHKIIIIVIINLSFFTIAHGATYHSLENVEIEIRGVSEKPTDHQNETLSSVDGSQFTLVKNPLMLSTDFEGIELANETVRFHFKRHAWSKLMEVTERYKNKKLAIVINNIVYSTAVVREPIARTMHMSGTNFKNYKQLVQTIKKSDRPHYLENQDVYLDFLTEHIKTHPKDLSSVKTLAYSYISDPITHQLLSSPIEKNCKLSIPLFSRLIGEEPNDTSNYTSLAMCYQVTGQLENALLTIEKSLPYYQAPYAWIPYVGMGNILIASESYDKAVDVLEKGINILGKSKMLPPEMDLKMAKLFLANSIESKTLAQFNTIDELEVFLKKDTFQHFEELLTKAKHAL